MAKHDAIAHLIHLSREFVYRKVLFLLKEQVYLVFEFNDTLLVAESEDEFEVDAEGIGHIRHHVVLPNDGQPHYGAQVANDGPHVAPFQRLRNAAHLLILAHVVQAEAHHKTVAQDGQGVGRHPLFPLLIQIVARTDRILWIVFIN